MSRGPAKRGVARPWWASALAAFCLGTAIFLALRDLFVPHVRDVEVWFGFELHGGLAMATAPIHWAIFGIGAWGFWRVRPWIWPWASVYAFVVALSHVIWSELSPTGPGLATGLLYGIGFSLPAIALLWARPPA